MINYFQVYRPGIGVMQAGDVVQLTQGDVLQVAASFNYKAIVATTVHLHGFIGNPLDPAADNSQEVFLPAVSEFVAKTATVDIPTSSGYPVVGLETPPGTYNLMVRIDENPDTYDIIPNCITVVEKAGMLDTIMQMVTLMIVVMMMGMIMPMMAVGEKPKELEKEV